MGSPPAADLAADPWEGAESRPISEASLLLVAPTGEMDRDVGGDLDRLRQNLHDLAECLLPLHGRQYPAPDRRGPGHLVPAVRPVRAR